MKAQIKKWNGALSALDYVHGGTSFEGIYIPEKRLLITIKPALGINVLSTKVDKCGGIIVKEIDISNKEILDAAERLAIAQKTMEQFVPELDGLMSESKN